MSIFVSVASYKDIEMPKTIKSLMDSSDDPENIRVVVLSQDFPKKHPDLSQYKNVELVKVDFRESKGAGHARNIIMNMYSGEDYFFQIDSHTRFAKGWDAKLIKMIEQLALLEKTKKIILSQFPAPYFPEGRRDFFPKEDQELWCKPSWTKVINKKNGEWGGERQEIKDLSSPQPSHTVLAGYIFAHGDFALEIPYDERITFMGEELCIAMRSYTRGWKIYAPNEMLLWHFYKRKNRPKVWDQVDDSLRKNKWIHLEMESKKIQRSVLTGEEFGVFGYGDYSKYLEYQDLIGTDFKDFYKNKMKQKVNSGVYEQELTISHLSGRI